MPNSDDETPQEPVPEGFSPDDQQDPVSVESMVEEQYDEPDYEPDFPPRLIPNAEPDLPVLPADPQLEPQPEPQAPVDPLDEAPEGEYLPYDLMKVKPSLFDPVDEEGRLDPEGRVRLRDEDGNVLPEFDERYREDFEGLVFLGSLSKTFRWLGHRFTIRTITVDEQLHVALLTKAYAGSLGDALAYRTAVAALSVQRVDGEDLPVPIGPSDGFAYAQQRFDFVKARWFQYTIDAIYNEYLGLDDKVHQVVLAMGKVSTSSP